MSYFLFFHFSLKQHLRRQLKSAFQEPKICYTSKSISPHLFLDCGCVFVCSDSIATHVYDHWQVDIVARKFLNSLESPRVLHWLIIKWVWSLCNSELNTKKLTKLTTHHYTFHVFIGLSPVQAGKSSVLIASSTATCWAGGEWTVEMHYLQMK